MKKTRIVSIFLVAVLLVTAAVTGVLSASAAVDDTVSGSKGQIDVWLIGGQSNAVGYGAETPEEAKTDSRYYTGFDNVLYYGVHESKAENYSEFLPITMGLGQKQNRSGAELGIAKALDGTGVMNAVIKCAYGATYLYPNNTGSGAIAGTWTPPSYIEKANMDSSDPNYAAEGTYVPFSGTDAVDIPNVDTSLTITSSDAGCKGKTFYGNMYNMFISTVTEGVLKLKEMGYTPVLRGMWWMQGEAESNNATFAALYDELLTCLINDIRAEMNTIFGGTQGTDMPFVCGNIYRNHGIDPSTGVQYTQPTYLNKVNEAQAFVAENLDYVYVLENGDDDEGLADGETAVAKDGYTDQPFFAQQDAWHFNAATQQYFGEKFVEFALSATNEYTVSSSGKGASINGGFFKAGDNVTVNFRAEQYYTVEDISMSVDGGEAIDIPIAVDVPYTFVMPEGNVVFNVTASLAGVETETAYGTISAEYVSVEDYPFALFKNGNFVGAYGYYGAAMANIAQKDNSDNYTLLLRRDYMTAGFDRSGASAAATLGGNVTLDLGWNSLSRGPRAYLFDISHKSANTYATTINVKNGKLLTVSNKPLMALNYTTASAGYSAKTYNFNFDNVSFINMYDALSQPMIFACWENASSTASAGLNANVVYNDCTFDMGNKSGGVFMSFTNGSAVNTKVTAKINGGKIYSPSAKFTLYQGDSADSVILGKYNGNYPELTLGVQAEVSSTFMSEDGLYLHYANPTEKDGAYVYELVVSAVEETPYGTIDLNAYPATTHPFILFDAGGFVKAYDSYYSFLRDMASSPITVDSTLYVRRDWTTSNDTKVSNTDDRNLNCLKAVLTIDLNGKTVTRGSQHLLESMGNGTSVTVKVKNGTLVAANSTIIPFNNTGKSTNVSTFNWEFDNVTFTTSSGYKNPVIVDAYEGSNVTGMKGNITFNNCTFDMTNASSSAVMFKMLDKNDVNKFDISIKIMGGTVKADQFNFTFATFDNERSEGEGSPDSVKFGSYNGAYTKFIASKGASIPKIDLESVSGENIAWTDISDSNNAIYTLAVVTGPQEDVAVEGYGTIPYAYSNEEMYPFILFNSDGFVKAYATYYTFLTDMKSNPIKTASTLYLRRNWTTSNDSKADNNDRNLNCLKAPLTIDLNGKTMTRGSQHLLQAMGNGTDITITVKNGTLVADKGVIIPFNNTGSSSYVETFTLVFENVTFSTAQGYASTALIAAYHGGSDAGSRGNITFNNCIFDFEKMTDASKVFNLMDANSVNKVDITVTVNGGIIKAGAFNYTFADYDTERSNTNGSPDSIIFGMYNGEYPELMMNSDAELPENMSEVHPELVYKKVSDDGVTAVYKLGNSEMKLEGLKAGVSMYSDFNVNLYIPEFFEEHITVMINGNVQKYSKTTVNGVAYLTFTVPVACDRVDTDVQFVIELLQTVGGSRYTTTETVTVSIAKYAQTILSSEGYTDAEKVLAYYMLSYANEAYKYFAEKTSAKISDILANETYKAYADKYTVSAYDAKNEGLSDAFDYVTVDVESTPKFVLGVKDGFVGTITVAYENGANTRVYNVTEYSKRAISINGMKIYNFGTTLTITAVGTLNGEAVSTSGVYNLDSFVSYHETNAADANASEKCLGLVKALYAYAEVAELYANGTLEGRLAS